MNLCSLFFIFICLPITLGVYYIIPMRHREMRNRILFLFSILFYAFGEPVGVFVLLLSIWLGHFFGLAIEHANQVGQKRAAMRIFSLATMLQIALLLLFHYLPALLRLVGVFQVGHLADTLLSFPIGIAIYSLQIISSLLSVARGEAHIEKALIPFGLSVAFFGKIIAGPLVSYDEFSRQVQDRRESMERFGSGASQFIVGLAKKLLLADTIYVIWSAISDHEMAELSVLASWIGLIVLAFYLYFDLSGYADMAIGLGRMFGFELPESFYYPYRAVSVEDFYTRWNMTVVDWFRKLFSFSGQSEEGRNLLRALGAVLFGLLFAVWHGAKLRFLMFGLYTGIVLALDPLVLSGVLLRMPEWVRRILTFILVGVGWIFLVLPPSDAFAYIASMFGGGAGFIDAIGTYYLKRSVLLLLVMWLASTPFGAKTRKRLLDKTGSAGRALLLLCYAGLLFLSMAALVTNGSSSFFLFQS